LKESKATIKTLWGKSGHYGHNAGGWWLFDQEKKAMVPGCLSIMLWLFLLTLVTFCYFLLLFLLFVNFGSYFLLSKGVRFVTFSTFFTAGNYDKLLFTRPRELLGFIVQGGNLKG
jgi:hypothetical protein